MVNCLFFLEVGTIVVSKHFAIFFNAGGSEANSTSSSTAQGTSVLAPTHQSQQQTSNADTELGKFAYKTVWSSIGVEQPLATM